MSKPTVSIGLPTYNGSKTIRRTLDTLLNQTYKDFELIISDNASTDGKVPEICEEYAARDPRIRYIRQKENIGGANFKFLVDAAQGDYFMWAADDDEWEPEFIRELVELHIENPEAIVAFCAHDNLTFSGEVLQFHPPLFPEHENLNKYHRFKRFLLDRGGKCNYTYGLFKKKYLLNHVILKPFEGIPPQYSSMDTFFLFDMLLKGPFVSTPKLLWHKRCHGHDFKPERTVKDLSVFGDRTLFFRKMLHFLKTPYYAFFFYRVINDLIQKSFSSVWDRFRLYFFNTYRLFYFWGSRLFWALKLLFSFFVGLFRLAKKQIVKKS
ncbi:MAG: glycosyltransferase family 2 protein [Candidatus Gracilibacteria bacterium]